MSQLLSAGFTRLIKSRLFWAGNILMVGFFTFLLFSNFRSMNAHPDFYQYTGDSLLFAPFQIIGIFASCFTGLFLGTEYSDGTLRNKLIVGKSRSQVYLTNLILSFTATLIVCGIAILTCGALGTFLFGSFELTPVQVLSALELGVLTLTAFAGIFTLMSMLIPYKSASSVVCLLGFFLLLLAAVYIASRLGASEFITDGYSITIDGVQQIGEPHPNPYYLRGTARNVFEFFQILLPTGQGNLLMAQETNHSLRMALCSLGITACTTMSGIFGFNKKDLK